jgi:hypothetical protein
MKNPARFIALKKTISMELVFENPFAGHNIGVQRLRNKISGLALNEGSILLCHSSAPIWIGESCSVATWKQRKS